MLRNTQNAGKGIHPYLSLNYSLVLVALCVSSKPIAKLQFVAQYVWVLNRY